MWQFNNFPRKGGRFGAYLSSWWIKGAGKPGILAHMYLSLAGRSVCAEVRSLFSSLLFQLVTWQCSLQATATPECEGREVLKPQSTKQAGSTAHTQFLLYRGVIKDIRCGSLRCLRPVCSLSCVRCHRTGQGTAQHMAWRHPGFKWVETLMTQCWTPDSLRTSKVQYAYCLASTASSWC